MFNLCVVVHTSPLSQCKRRGEIPDSVQLIKKEWTYFIRSSEKRFQGIPYTRRPLPSFLITEQKGRSPRVFVTEGDGESVTVTLYRLTVKVMYSYRWIRKESRTEFKFCFSELYSFVIVGSEKGSLSKTFLFFK